MAQLRLRIELNKGGLGISMDKLAGITEETAKFLRMVVTDVARDVEGKWIARDFDNNSVDFTAEFVGAITPDQIQACNHALAFTMSEDIDYEYLENVVSRRTLLQYAKIAKPIEPDEVVHFRLFEDGNLDRAPHFILSKQRSLEIERRLELSDRIQYFGSIQGIITALFKDTLTVSKPHCRVRRLYSDDLIPCYFSYDLYDKVIKALQSKDAVVNIAGWVTASRTERKPIDVLMKKIEPAEEYLEGDLEKFIGCAPHATGDLTTEQFIEGVRGNGDLTTNSD
jgi:hypothetical protein